MLPFLYFLFEVPASELVYELTSAGMGTLVLVSPYVGLAWLGRHARPLVGYGALALLLVGSGLVFVAASSDAQGALIAIYVLALQWFLAALAGSRRFSAPRHGARSSR